ncbi:MAG: UDP-N-acetylmuramate dehydrogenase, partial [Bacteroidota bacterium]
MTIEEHKSLRPYNTFGIECKARYFVSVSTVDELKKALQLPVHAEKFILGGGSNILLTKDIDALVIHVNLKGITVDSETERHVIISAMAGENWHQFVMHCIENNFGGIENLSLIPGNVGTAPIQNIGAYGVELKDVFVDCTAVSIADGSERVFTLEDCAFSYRNSIFKQKEKGNYVITAVRFRLSKAPHTLHTSYGAIREKLAQQQIDTPSIREVSDTVISIRQSKLPDPAELGNSGSFFKNPVLNAEAFQRFRTQHPEAPFYEVSPTLFKVPAGWLIEQAGFKGNRYGDAGVHAHAQPVRDRVATRPARRRARIRGTGPLNPRGGPKLTDG